MKILGVNAYHGDSSACLIDDGRLLGAVEEERFRRVKHWAGFPAHAIQWCLDEAGLKLSDIDAIAVNRSTAANFWTKFRYTLIHRPSWQLITSRLRHRTQATHLERDLRSHFKLPAMAPLPPIHHVEHHQAHLASAFFVSPFNRAAIVSVDSFGDFVSTMWAVGQGSRMKVLGRIHFPHSLGHFYLSLTQYLGFKRYGDEYKVMGLAAFGRPCLMDQMREMVRLEPEGRYRLNLRYFCHHREGNPMTWRNTEPTVVDGYSRALRELLGPPRKPQEPINDHHKNVAASVQKIYEEVFFRLLQHVQGVTGLTDLCLAGGCAMNSLANGKIFSTTRFRRVYVQAAPGDAGGALGAAYYVFHQKGRQKRSFVMRHAFWGSECSNGAVERVIKHYADPLRSQDCLWRKQASQEDLCGTVARAIASGKVVGWCQGRMEWGPRALGNRSILCDPRLPNMKELLNEKIKRRESFRPFAPSILREHMCEWFETDHEVPFMSLIFKIRSEKRHLIPAVTHVDGTGRPQTVTREENPLFHELITSFYRVTGVPLVLNTSFNENEPIVMRPEEALKCFLRTDMDLLVVGQYVVYRQHALEGALHA